MKNDAKVEIKISSVEKGFFDIVVDDEVLLSVDTLVDILSDDEYERLLKSGVFKIVDSDRKDEIVKSCVFL